MSFPRTLSAGAPYAVLSSTPGNSKLILRTVSKLIVLIGMCEKAIIGKNRNLFKAVYRNLADSALFASGWGCPASASFQRLKI